MTIQEKNHHSFLINEHDSMLKRMPKELAAPEQFVARIEVVDVKIHATKNR
jgi:hypothetical protein